MPQAQRSLKKHHLLIFIVDPDLILDELDLKGKWHRLIDKINHGKLYMNITKILSRKEII